MILVRGIPLGPPVTGCPAVVEYRVHVDGRVGLLEGYSFDQHLIGKRERGPCVWGTSAWHWALAGISSSKTVKYLKAEELQ